MRRPAERNLDRQSGALRFEFVDFQADFAECEHAKQCWRVDRVCGWCYGYEIISQSVPWHAVDLFVVFARLHCRPPSLPLLTALRHPGSVISTLVAYPIDVIKTRMIVSGSGGAVTKGMGETLVDILQLRFVARILSALFARFASECICGISCYPD